MGRHLRVVDQLIVVEDHILPPHPTLAQQLPVLDGHPPPQNVQVADGVALMADVGAHYELLGLRRGHTSAGPSGLRPLRCPVTTLLSGTLACCRREPSVAAGVYLFVYVSKSI